MSVQTLPNPIFEKKEENKNGPVVTNLSRDAGLSVREVFIICEFPTRSSPSSFGGFASMYRVHVFECPTTYVCHLDLTRCGSDSHNGVHGLTTGATSQGVWD